MAVNTANVPPAVPEALWTLCLYLNERRRLLEQLEQVARCAAELTASDHADITLFDATLRRFIPLRSTQVFIHQGEPDAAAKVRETKRPVIVPDLNFSASDEDLALFNRDIASYLAVPVMDGARVDAALVVFSREARNYDSGEQQTLEGLAALAAVALKQKRLSLGLEDASRTLLKLSLSDPYTGIATRKQFDQMLQHEWNRAISEGLSISLLQLEIDGIDDDGNARPHSGAQEALSRAARTLRAALYRAGDSIALLGDGRLAVIMPDTDQTGAVAIARRLQRDVAGYALNSDEEPLTLSIGISSFDTLQLQRGVFGTPEKLVRQAAAALEQAKRAGGNQLKLVELAD
ncbi:MAG TPA: diguanylate cyclase [Trueperaceae bacterium]